MKTNNGLYGTFLRGFIAVVLITALMGTGSANALGGRLFGQPLGIDFGGDDLVSTITVQVSKGWLNSDNFSLTISIYGINGGYREHGYQEVPLSDTQMIQILGYDQGAAFIQIDWNTDILTPSSPEDYTACVQVLVNGNEIGGELCSWVGSF